RAGRPSFLKVAVTLPRDAPSRENDKPSITVASEPAFVGLRAVLPAGVRSEGFREGLIARRGCQFLQSGRKHRQETRARRRVARVFHPCVPLDAPPARVESPCYSKTDSLGA